MSQRKTLKRGTEVRFSRIGPATLGLAVCCTAVFAQMPVLAQVPCRYEISAIIPGPICPEWGQSPVFARGLSNHDPPWVAGFYTECVVGPEKAFVWTGSGALQPLQFPGAGIEESFAFDVTDTGLVVGAYAQSGQPFLGYIFDVASGGGEWTQVNPAIPGGGVVLRAANNAGMVVGSRTISQTAYNAFIYHNGTYTDLGVMSGPYSEAWAVNAAGNATGWTGNAQGAPSNRAFLHANGQTTLLPLLPNGTSGQGWSINNANDVAGSSRFNLQSGASRTRAVRWRDEQISDLGVLQGYRHSAARAISEDGMTILGISSVLESGTPSSVACVWRNEVITNLNTLLTDAFNLILIDAYSINSRGQVLCEGSYQGNQVAVLLNPVFAPVADITLDCRVSVPDLLRVINEWSMSESVADLDGNGTVGVGDLIVVIENWTTD